MTTRDTMYSEDISDSHKHVVSVLQDGVTKLPPELDEAGNVEYKTKLDNTSSHRAIHLATQLQWRLAEGDGHALYIVGVHDNGDVVGISDKEFEHTIDTLENMAQQLDNARIVSIKKRVLHDSERVVAEVRLAQKAPLPQTELRVAVLGDYGAGKSTVLGCLTHGEADDGRGKARLNLMRHQHELESGHTSSITLSTVGFDGDGRVQNYTNNRSAEHIFQRSQHVVTFIDTCGHAKHLKTTARALTGYSPHVFCVVIPADAVEVSTTTREYIQIAAALGMPLMVAVSKMDIADKAGFAALMHELLGTLDAVLPERSKCIVVNVDEHQSLADDMMRMSVVPIFTTSAVRTLGFGDLTAVLGKSLAKRVAYSTDGVKPFEFHIEHLYSIDTVGTVATGWVHSGAVAAGGAADTQQLVIGPDSSGNFVEADVSSIHTLRTPTESAKAGMSASLAIQPRSPITIQKGMVVLGADQLEAGGRRISSEFTATVTVLCSDLVKMQAVVVHIRSTYHLATIVDIGSSTELQPPGCAQATTGLRLRLSGNVRELIYPGMPVVARDGRSLTFAGRVTAAM
ncbi:hypothetical protein J3F81_001842 [Coemansia sp. RSA 371]|nr:hypothetical protein J3F81_001842 [Coemansia sp. RSA 371]